MVVEPDPVADHSYCMLLAFEAVSVCTLLLQRRMKRSIMPFCRGQCGVMNSCRNP